MKHPLTVTAIPAVVTCLSLVFPLLFISPAASHAQDFRPGYIVAAEGDTTRGFIAYRSAGRNSRECLFRETETSETVSHTPSSIIAYGINGDKAYEVLTPPANAPSNETVFAQLLATGELSLYKVNNYYLVKKDVLYVLEPPDESEPKSAGVYLRLKPYVGVLNNLVGDCGLNADKTSYGEQSVTRLIQSYNRCKNPDADIREVSKGGVVVSPSVFAGYMSSGLTYDYNVSIPFDGTTMTGGIAVDLTPRKFDKFSFSVEAWYVDCFYQGYHEESNTIYEIREDLFVNIKAIKIPVGVRYSLRSSSISSPYVKLGFLWSPLLESSVYSVRESEDNDGDVFTEEVADPFEVKSPKGVWIAAGYATTISNKLKGFLEFRYEGTEGYLGTGIQNYSKLKSFQFIAGIRF